MKQQIKRAEKNLQDALKLISEDNIEKDLLHDYIFDALKAVENLNLDAVSKQRKLLLEYAENVISETVEADHIKVDRFLGEKQ
jgi:hypothetical protein